MRKYLFLLLAISNVSFSNLYQRFENSNQYFNEINEYGGTTLDERLYGYYVNADLLSEKDKIKEREYIVSRNPSLNSFLITIENSGKLYNIDEILKIFLNKNNKYSDEYLAYILEVYIQKGYFEQLKKMYHKKNEYKYIKARLNYNYSDVLKYEISEEIRAIILRDMQASLIQNIRSGKIEDINRLLDFTDKYLEYFTVSDRKSIFKILVELQTSLGIVSKIEKKYVKSLKKVERINEKMIKKEEIRLLDLDFNILDKQFIELRR